MRRFAALVAAAAALGTVLAVVPAAPVAARTVDWTSTSLGAHGGVRGMTAGDIDGDGDVDLATADSADLAWYENQLGTWARRTLSSDGGGGTGDDDVALGDIDGDGDLDAVGAWSASTADVRWYENNGTPAGGAWAPLVIATGGGQKVGVDVADVNRDGDLDVVVAASADGLTYYDNDGDPSDGGWTAQAVDATVEFVQDVEIADVDGDGWPDIVAATRVGDSYSWYRNDETPAAGTWAQDEVATGRDETYAVDAADIDGDGDMDIAGATFAPGGTLAWFENTAGDGTAWTDHEVATTTTGRDVRAGDVDGDGDVDLVGVSGAGATDLHENTDSAGGTWTTHDVGIATEAAWIVDADNDGDTDVATVEDTAGAIVNTNETIHATLRLQATNTIGVALSSPTSVATGDLDGDGDLDLAVNERVGDTVRWLESDGAAEPTFTSGGPALATDVGDASAVAVGDVDGDGQLDVIAAAYADDDIRWWSNSGAVNPTFAEGTPVADTADGLDGPSGLVAVDFDRDGDLDVVSSDDLSGNVLLHRNGNASGGGDGSVWTTFDVALGLGSASGVAVGDMDGDGILDVTATDFTGDTVRWWRNADRAAPAFTGQSSVTVQSANHVAVADVDRDGALDWVASGGTGTLSWFANDGAGGAGWVEENIATLGTVQDVRVADIDLDGDLDVTATTLNPGADAFYWWRNDDGTGTDWTGLSRSITFAAGLDVGDLDGDGDLDVASADFGLDAQWYETDLFQADVSSQDGASVTALDEGTEGRLLEVRYEHLGRTGDRDGCATSLRVVFESSTGVAMTSAQLDALVDEVRVRADDGDGTFETSDTELHSSTTHVLDVDGGVDLALTCAPTAFVAFDFDQLWVTVELEEDAADQTVTTVLASVDGTATVAIDAESVLDIELSARGTHTPSSVVTATQVVDVAPPAPAPADDDDDDDDRDERRIAGTNRYETAAALSARMGNVDTVYVATGHDYADALAVGPVAGIEGAALLLVEPDAVPEATADELERIGAARVVVVGGTAAVSDAVFDAVGADERIAGPTRYETAAALAADAFPLGASTVHLVSGSSFADASSAGPSAGLAGGPILLVRSDGTIPAAAAEQLTRLAPTTVVVVGGGGAISSRVVDAVGAVVPAATVERAGGVSRYLTAVALAERLGADVDTVYVATGLDFADALAAAPAAIDDRAPILLVPVDTPVPDGVVAYVDRIDPEDVLVIGGTAAVPRARVAELR